MGEHLLKARSYFCLYRFNQVQCCSTSQLLQICLNVGRRLIKVQSLITSEHYSGARWNKTHGIENNYDLGKKKKKKKKGKKDKKKKKKKKTKLAGMRLSSGFVFIFTALPCACIFCTIPQLHFQTKCCHFPLLSYQLN